MTVRKKLVLALFIAALMSVAPLKLWCAVQPLSQDDVALLLIGGASEQKMLALIQQRGIDFQMNPDLAKKFHDDGASDNLIEALTKAGLKVQSAPPAAATQAAAAQPAPPQPPASTPGPMPGPAPGSTPGPAPAAPNGSAAPASTATAPRPSMHQAIEEAVKDDTAGSGSEDTPPASTRPVPGKAPAAAPNLSDPSPAQVQNIIQTFAAKEARFKRARDNYTYHQINKVQTLDAEGNPTGSFEQDWDVLFDDNGNRIEHVTYAPENTLKGLLVTQQDMESFRSIQPFVLTTDDLPEYEVKYLGHVKVDYITAYVFSVRPKEIRKGKVYFKGVVWVDDRDLQIVKSEGRTVPQPRGKNGQNLFPRFTTWRQQIDGKYWFPTFTMANDTLYFDSGPIRIKEIVKYTDYKQFRSRSRIGRATVVDAPSGNPQPPPKQ